MLIDKHITMDSFGSNCPDNWEKVAAYLNAKIDAILESYGDNAEYDPDCLDEIDQLWENYCNGNFDNDINLS